MPLHMKGVDALGLSVSTSRPPVYGLLEIGR